MHNKKLEVLKKAVDVAANRVMDVAMAVYTKDAPVDDIRAAYVADDYIKAKKELKEYKKKLTITGVKLEKLEKAVVDARAVFNAAVADADADASWSAFAECANAKKALEEYKELENKNAET